MDEDHELFHACDPECTSCHDIDGSYECHCKPGFESTDGSTDTDRKICTDIINCGFDDSCEDARTTCIDTPGCADPNKCDHDCFNDKQSKIQPSSHILVELVIISMMTTSLVLTMKNVPLVVPTL